MGKRSSSVTGARVNMILRTLIQNGVGLAVSGRLPSTMFLGPLQYPPGVQYK